MKITAISVLLLMMIFCIDSSSLSSSSSSPSGSATAATTSSWSRRPWILGGWKKVLMTEVPTLHLNEGVLTFGRNPAPQLRCIGGTARCKNRVIKAECHNLGSSEKGVLWGCIHVLPGDGKGLKLGSEEIRCESGYGHDYDPYVIEGSCWLEYTVDLTFRGMWRLLTFSYYEGPWTKYEVKMMIRDLLLLPFFVIIVPLVFLLYKIICFNKRTKDNFVGGGGGEDGNGGLITADAEAASSSGRSKPQERPLTIWTPSFHDKINTNGNGRNYRC